MNQSLLLILVVVVAAIGIPIYLKKRKNKNTEQIISNRRNKDEVWKTIKQYLKDTNEYGKEIIDSYVAKRNDVDFINPHKVKFVKNNKRQEIKIRRWQFKQEKKLNPKLKIVRPKPHDLYVVCFVTKSTRDQHIDPPRAIECEVINKKIDRKNWDRKIVINRLLDYDKEMEWIAPLRSAEEVKTSKAEKQAIKAQKRKEKAVAKKRAKEKAQSLKSNK